MEACLRVAQKLPRSGDWMFTHEYQVQGAFKVFHAGLWLFLACWFSNVRSLDDFVKRNGLSKQPDYRGWIVAWVVIGIALLDRYGVTKGWTSANTVTRGFFNSEGGVLLFYVIFVNSIGPFYEEVVMRGFLYKAFRNNYGKLISTSIVLLVAVYFHWSTVGHSLYTAACLVSLWIVLCALREWTGNTWSCILCHAIYNAVDSFSWPIYISAMIVLSPFCMLRSRTPDSGKGVTKGGNP